MVSARIFVNLDLLTGLPQGGRERPRCRSDARVESSEMKQHRHLHLCGLGRVWRRAVIGNGSGKLVAGSHREPVDETSAPAKADRPDLAAGARSSKFRDDSDGV